MRALLKIFERRCIIKKKKLTKLFVFIPPIIFAILYGGGFIAQFIANYAEWQSAGSEGAPMFPSGNILDCLVAVFNFPYGLYGIIICVILFAILILIVMRLGHGEKGEHDRERNLTYSNKGTYGTAGFMTEEEMGEVLDSVANVKQTDGTILGKLDGKTVCLPAKTMFNRNVAVYGPSGSMKSRAYARNMVLQCVKRGESIFMTDPKSELYEDMNQYLRNNGYTVKVFNLINPEFSDSWNCLAEIDGDEIMAQIFATVIIKNTGSIKGDHFWDNAELNLLKALVIYIERNYPAKDKNIGEVYKLLSIENENHLEALFETLPMSHPAKAPFSIFKKSSDTVKSGVVGGLANRLQVFQSNLIRQITSHDEIDLTLPGKEKCAYFVITSDQDSTFDFIVSLFFSFVFIKLVRFADSRDDRLLPVPVHIIGDEWCNAAGAVFDFTKKISTIRSRNVSISILFQNIAQLKNRYPQDQWQEILGNCDLQLFLGATDEMTAKYVSDRTGEVTIGVSSKAKMLGTWRISNYAAQFRETASIGKRKLMTPDEVLRLPINQALVIVRGQKVLKVDKFDYTLHPESRKLKPTKASSHIPAWRRKIASSPNAPRQPSSVAKPAIKDITPSNGKAVVADKKSILS